MGGLNLLAFNITADVILEAASILVALLVGTGAFAFFIRYGNRLSVMEKGQASLEQTVREKVKQVEGLNSDMADVQVRLGSIQDSLRELKENSTKLNLIGEMNAKLDSIQRTTDKAISSAEYMAWKEYVVARIDNVEDHISKECPLKGRTA